MCSVFEIPGRKKHRETIIVCLVHSLHQKGELEKERICKKKKTKVK